MRTGFEVTASFARARCETLPRSTRTFRKVGTRTPPSPQCPQQSGEHFGASGGVHG